MNKKQLLIATLILLFTSTATYAYFENYPPYKFKNDPPMHIKAKLLVDLNKPEFKSGDGVIVASLSETAEESNFLLKEGKTTLLNRNIKTREEVAPIPHAVYQFDLDNNGLKDFIILSSYRGAGLAGYNDVVEILLKKQDGSYANITYDTMKSGIEDFVDLNKNDECEIIITGFHFDNKHNYFTYNIYEIKNYKLVNADSKFKGFPKFIWNTNKPNDKDTKHLTKEQRCYLSNEKDSSIYYNKIPPLGEPGVRLVIGRLNREGIIFNFDKKAKKDEIFGYDKKYGFSIADTGAGWYLYKVDINNDKEDEYVLTSHAGSGGFFDIEAIYKDKDGKLSDIYGEIKIPMRRLIRKSEKGYYKLDDGYIGFMKGSIDIEDMDGKIYFTLNRTIRDYGIDDYEKSFHPPEHWKFLWDKDGLRLIEFKANPAPER